MNLVVRMLITLTIVGVVSGGVLNSIWDWADPLIAENARIETENAIKVVQPEIVSKERVETQEMEVYKIFDKSKVLLGYAAVAIGNGFQGKIKLMFGVKPDMKELVNLTVLDQSETPGLGTEVTQKEKFTNQFKKLTADPLVGWVKEGASTKPNEIQAKTGATISSKALVAIVNGGLKKLRSIKELGGNNE